MEHIIARMLERFESGNLSRRQLVQGLAALAAGAPLSRADGPPFQGAGLNHIALRVTDIPRSRDFYRGLFGLPVIRDEGSSCFLGLGKEFLALFKNEKAGLDHYCIAIEKFSADSVMETLNRRGLKPRRPSGTDRVYFPDPDGIEVQISAIDHAAG
jgi:catechol 2,3-dioxygenase-like lactoylglutathione lyase family enzyme